MAQQSRNVVLTLPAKAEYVALSRLAMSAVAGPSDLDDENADDMKVAVTEACSYFIREGEKSPQDDPRELRIEYEVLAEGVSVSILGSSALASSPGLADDPLSEFGLGMTIIRALVDELAMEPVGGTDLLLRLTKRRA